MPFRPSVVGRRPWLREPSTELPMSTSAPSSGGSPKPVPKPGQLNQRPLAKAAANAIIIALRGIKEGSPAAPHVQGVAGALLVIVETYKKYCSTAEAIVNLQEQVEKLVEMLNKAIPTDPTKFPPALKERLERLTNQVQSIAKTAETLQAQPWLIRLLNAEDAAGEVESYANTLTWYIHSFTLESTMAVELNLHAMAEDMRQGVAHLSSQVAHGFEDVRSDVNTLGAEPITGIKAAIYSSLRPVVQARFDHGDSNHVSCDPNTRREVLASICLWLRPDDPRLATLPPLLPTSEEVPGSSILWIHGLAGFGKSTIARTIAEWWKEDGILGATFFCARDRERSNLRSIFRTIAYQLACRYPAFCDALTKVIEADPDIRVSLPSQQLKELIVEPLKFAKAQQDFPSRIAVVIDALDECTDQEAVSTILKSLSLHISELTPLKFVITSRPEENIARGFLLDTLRANTQQLSLTKVPRPVAQRDISNFLKRRLTDIRERYSLGPDWPPESQFNALLGLADGLFIYAATAILFVGDDKVRDPDGQLLRLLEAGRSATVTEGEGSTPALRMLDTLYKQVLNRAREKLDESARARLKIVLGIVTLTEERLSPASIDALLKLSSGEVRRILPALNAVVHMPAVGDEHTPIRVIHLSFPNFLMDPSRCTSPEFLVNPTIHHTYIALRCLQTLRSLKHNICGIASEHSHLFNVDIPGLPDRIAQHLAPALQYACKYWVFHLCRAELGEELLTALDHFCNTHLLHWLEALSLLGCLDAAVDALQSAQVFLKKSGVPLPQARTDAPKLLHDCERIVRAFYLPISASFFQVYKSAIVFSPTESPLRLRHAAEVPDIARLVHGAQQVWSTALSSTNPPSGYICALDFSHDGRYIVSGDHIGTVWLWSMQTGTPLVPFEGHTGYVLSVSFSPTGREILSGSIDKTIKIWDVATATCLDTWEKHSQNVNAVAWSPDGALAASGSDDKSVILWHITSDEEPAVLSGHGEGVTHVIFVTDRVLLSASKDHTCRIWDIRTKTLNRVLRHSSSVRCAAASSDGRIVACGLDTGEIVIWNRADGLRLRSLVNTRSTRVVKPLAFFPKNYLAAANGYSSCALWDVFRGELLKSEDISSSSTVAFSQDGVLIAHASASSMTVQEWSSGVVEQPMQAPSARNYVRTIGIVTRCCKQVLGSKLGREGGAEENLDDTDAKVTGLSLSPDRRFVLVAHKRRLRLLNASTGECMRVIKHSDGWRTAWSPHGDLFASTGPDNTIYVWETETGRPIATLSGHSKGISAVCFTAGDEGKQIVSASRDGTIRRWNLELRKHPPGTSSEVLFCSNESIGALSVSSDGQWILSASWSDCPPRTSSANVLFKPSGQPPDCGRSFHTLRLLHATGHVLWMEHHNYHISSLAFSEDRTRAVAGNLEGEVFLYDLTHLIALSSNHPISPSVPPPLVQERQFDTVSERWVHHLSFSRGGPGILTESSYIPLDQDLQTLYARTGAQSCLPFAYYLDGDGWLWRDGQDPEPRRICWIPPSIRPDSWMHWAASGNTVVYVGRQGQLVLADLSRV